MTLIVSEVNYYPEDAERSCIISAADRLVSAVAPNGRRWPDEMRRKQFRVRGLEATVSQFGVANLTSSSDTLESLLQAAAGAGGATIEQFARALMAEFGRRIDPRHLLTQPSALQICGFNDDGAPEVWIITNFESDGSTYCCGPMLRLDEMIGPMLAKASKDHLFTARFINGEFVPAWRPWDLLDEVIATIPEHTPATARSVTPHSLRDKVYWKMKTIAGYHEFVAELPDVGGHIDVELLQPRLRHSQPV